jgi:hypothetical protein
MMTPPAADAAAAGAIDQVAWLAGCWETARLAWIEGPGKAPNAVRRIELPYRRVACAGERRP